jgi:hypothetical protein
MMVIHYHKQTGRIGAWGSGDSEYSHLVDHAILRIDTEAPIDPHWQRIEDDMIVEIDEAELATWNCPTVDEVAARIEIELRRTDQFMLADYPIDDDKLEHWKQYRIMLRNLSKHYQDAAEMIENCDAAPDDHDPMAALREGL